MLKSLLKPRTLSWKEYLPKAQRLRAIWKPIGWFYENVDNDKFDAWCAERFKDSRAGIRRSMQAVFDTAVVFAHRRGLPLVVDEGYIFYPPLYSRLLRMPAGRFTEETAVELAIERRYWGVMCTGYVRPGTPDWKEPGQIEWLQGLNRRILQSATGKPSD